jgi:hypothetical protein
LLQVRKNGWMQYSKVPNHITRHLACIVLDNGFQFLVIQGIGPISTRPVSFCLLLLNSVFEYAVEFYEK